MSTLPNLGTWQSTREGLHRAAQVLGIIRKTIVNPQPNYLHLSLRVYEDGITTGSLDTSGNEFKLDFSKTEIIYYASSDIPVLQTQINEHTPHSLLIALISQMQTVRSASNLLERTGDLETFSVNQGDSAIYGEVLYRVSTAFENFRSNLSGNRTPLALWPHHFDLSFLWFAGDGEDEEKDPHINFGFAPYSDNIDTPYIYAYVSPSPDDVTSHELPAPARWYTDGWTGVIVDYDDIRNQDNPEAFITSLLGDIYSVLSPVIEG